MLNYLNIYSKQQQSWWNCISHSVLLIHPNVSKNKEKYATGN